MYKRNCARTQLCLKAGVITNSTKTLLTMPSRENSSPEMGMRRHEFSFPHHFLLISDDLVSLFSVLVNARETNAVKHKK